MSGMIIAGEEVSEERAGELEKVKVIYRELLNFMLDNKERKVKNILEAALGMTSAKKRVRTITTFIKDSEGSVVGVKDSYFDRWMPLVGEQAVVFGTKTGSSSGLNPMSKDGLSQWSKQQTIARKESLALIERIQLDSDAEGFLAVEDIPAEKERIEAARTAVIDTDLGFETKEELVEYLEDEGHELPVMD